MKNKQTIIKLLTAAAKGYAITIGLWNPPYPTIYPNRHYDKQGSHPLPEG